MDAWPIEEMWLRPAATPLVCAMLPFVTAPLVRAVLDRDCALIARASAVVRFTQLQLAWVLGVTALGPRWSASPENWATHVFGGLCIATAMFAERAARRFASPAESRARLRSELTRAVSEVGPLLLSILAVAPAAFALRPSPRWLLGSVAITVVTWAPRRLCLVLRRGRRSVGSSLSAETTPPRQLRRGRTRVVILGWTAGAALSALLVGLVALPWTWTALNEEDAPHAGASLATWRLRIDPWDATAMLAAAWASRRRDEPDRALAQAREARRMGLASAPALELEAEVLAAERRCAEARAVFDRALRARAERLFEGDPLATPLRLGGYHVPPTLTTHCGGPTLPARKDRRSARESSRM